MWPKLCILLLTYTDSLDGPRVRYAEQTLRKAIERIVYEGQVSVHIADDGSPPGHVDRLVDIAGGYHNVKGVSTSNSERSGYGANYNLATQVVHQHAQIVLPLEDDWVLAEPMNIAPFVQAFSESTIGCIRLGYIGFTQELRGKFEKHAGRIYLMLDETSPERHVSSGHPRLETVEWERKVGPWPEGHDPGTTEFLWCGFPGARRNVAWDFESPRGGWFHHIGTEQARGDQR